MSDVRSALGIVFNQRERTEAPWSKGALDALMWAMDIPPVNERTPVLKQRLDRTEFVALVEIEVGCALVVGRPYPELSWWVERCMGPARPMARSLWDEVTVTWNWRDYAAGAVSALGWMVGTEERPTCMAPWRDGAGKPFSDRERQIMAFRLFRLHYPDEVVRRMLEAPGVDIHNL